MNVNNIDIRVLAHVCGLDVDGCEYDTAVDVRVLDANPALARWVWEGFGAVSAYDETGAYRIVTIRELLSRVGVDVTPREGWSESPAGRYSAKLDLRKAQRDCIARLILNRELARFNTRFPS